MQNLHLSRELLFYTHCMDFLSKMVLLFYVLRRLKTIYKRGMACKNNIPVACLKSCISIIALVK